jgi:hypothetical protein
VGRLATTLRVKSRQENATRLFVAQQANHRTALQPTLSRQLPQHNSSIPLYQYIVESISVLVNALLGLGKDSTSRIVANIYRVATATGLPPSRQRAGKRIASLDLSARNFLDFYPSSHSWLTHDQRSSRGNLAPTAYRKHRKAPRLQPSMYRDQSHIRVVELTPYPSFIKEQLSLEAEAREALPYVSTRCLFCLHLLTFHSNSTHARATSVLCARVCMLA